MRLLLLLLVLLLLLLLLGCPLRLSDSGSHGSSGGGVLLLLLWSQRQCSRSFVPHVTIAAVAVLHGCAIDSESPRGRQAAASEWEDAAVASVGRTTSSSRSSGRAWTAGTRRGGHSASSST